jgi:hypothetical protein
VLVLTISRRLGHGSAAFTLNTYTHLFADKGDAAAQAMDAALGRGFPDSFASTLGRPN